MESMSIGQYRSHDPPKNFAIRIKFSKVKPESVIPSAKFPVSTSDQSEHAQDALELVENKQEDEDEEEHVIHWQEKLFSRREFEYYSDPLNCTTSLEQKYHDDIENIKRTFGERQNNRVFTFTDSDDTSTLEDVNAITLCENDPLSGLVDKMSTERYTNMARKPINNRAGLRRRGLMVNEPTEAMKSNHVITTPFQRMHIMADLSPKPVNQIYDLLYRDERIICTIKIDSNGLIVIKPDIMEKKEFKIEVYHVVRCVYRYTFEDLSVMITKLQKSQETSLYNELYNRHAQLMQIHVGNELTPLPNSNEIFLHCFFEIVSAKNFEYSSLYVQYLLDLPPGWQSMNDDLFGVTQSCAINEKGVAHFSYPFQFQTLYQWPEENPDAFLNWPTLYLQVYSLDSWQRHRIEGYGYCQLPDVAGSTTVQVDMWRPKDDLAFSDMRRYFIGGTREMKDVTYVRKPVENEDSKLSKFYFKTVSTGSVVLRINTMLQTKVIEGQVSAVSKWKKAIKRVGGYVTAADSLSVILDAFHRARKRMLSAARSTLPVIS